MEFGNSKFISVGIKSIVLLNLLLLMCNVLSQNDLSRNYRRFCNKMRFPIHYPTADIPAQQDFIIVSDCPIDSFYWDSGNGSIKRNRIRLRNHEEENNWKFFLVLCETSFRTLEHYAFIQQCKEDSVILETRCAYYPLPGYGMDYSGKDIHDSVYGYCNSRHIRMKDADDTTTLTAMYKVVRDVNVVRLKLKKEHLILDSFLGVTDECGLFFLEIPLNEEVFFGFFKSPDFIIWIRFYISTDGSKPKRHKTPPNRKTRVRLKRDAIGWI